MKYLLPIALFCVLIGFVSAEGWAQTFCMENGTVFTCEGSFQDDNTGCAEGAPYSDQNYTYTICPDNPDDVIQVDFVAFNLGTSPNPNNSDYLTIYDGDNTGENSLGSYTGTFLQGIPVTATTNNTTGCLTFVFNPNVGAGVSPGWEALISCTTPCDTPIAQAIITDPVPQGAEQSVGVCLDQPVTFSDNGSFAQPGFVIDSYIWNFDDGDIDDTSGLEVSHSFDEPGEYVVFLQVEDNNGCTSLNLDPLQVLVSTIPIFNTSWDETICLGAEGVLNGNPVQSVTWTALPPQVVAGETFLADGAGFSYSTSLSFDFFEPGATLEDCDDLQSVFVNIEHTYLGDLQFELECPDGTTVILLEYPNGGGGTFLGEAIDDGGTDPGVGYDYSWDPDATNGTLGENAGGFGDILPSGTYQSDYDMCDFVGCPLNGDWTLSVIDNLAIDNGYIFYWGINFNPELFPGVTTFTPEIGLEADSSYWDGPFITDVSADANQITVLPDAVGIYDYVFTVTNNFGCTFDTTVQMEVYQVPQAFAGDDIDICLGDDTQLFADFSDADLPACTADAGTYDYCYDNNEFTTFTYCPDVADGISFIDVSFQQGTLENFFDFITIYDGDNTGAPILGSLTGDLSGQVFVATNATGCLTLEITSDGSGSCANGGFQTEMIYVIGCALGGPSYDIEWIPGTALSDPSSSAPLVEGLLITTEYELSIYPPGFPECATFDQVTVNVGEEVDAGISTAVLFCPTDGDVALYNELEGSPDTGGVWTDSNGDEVVGIFDTEVDQPDTFTYTVSDAACTEEAMLEVDVNYLEIQASPDTTVCINGTASLEVIPIGQFNDPITFSWNNGQASGESFDVSPNQNPTPVTVLGFYGDGCYTETQNILVSMYAPLQMAVMEDETVCQEVEFQLETIQTIGGLEPYTYTWEGDNGDVLDGNPVTVALEDEATYCLTVEDACETPTVTDCVTISLEELIPAFFEADLNGDCTPITVNFAGFAENTDIISNVIWDFGDGAVANTVNFASHTYLEPGVYDVSLTILSTAGCVYEEVEENYISSWPLPIANFSSNPQTAILPNTTIDFFNQSIGYTESSWTFGEFGVSNEMNPEFEFQTSQPEVINVELIVANEFGCVDTVNRVVFIQEDFVIYAPNTFTPDGDGLNDFWFVHGLDVNESDYIIQIFNRWGEMVFESDDITKPWNGAHENGQYYVEDAIYTWRIETRSLSTSDKKEIVGHVTVIR